MESLRLNAPVLAVESSCDDTACAILSHRGEILGERVHTQAEHARLGGVVPEIAARAHLSLLPKLVGDVLDEAGLSLDDIGFFAGTTGPGLIGGLIVGSNFAKGLAIATGKPFIAVNHIEAHALSARLPGGEVETTFPYLLLLLSGGHCQCVAVRGVGDYERLGTTLDDAVGEAFDKVAKLLRLGWPGGAALEKVAREGRSDIFALPRPLLGRKGCDFSFSGLKTAVTRHVGQYNDQTLTRSVVADLAASFQTCVADVLQDRACHALAMFPQARALVVAGGVAANQELRDALKNVATAAGIHFTAPPIRYCTDNAVMVGWAALETVNACKNAQKNVDDGIPIEARPRWPLDDLKNRS